MKKLIVIAMVLIGLQGIAQGQGKQEGKQNSRADYTPEQMATIQTKKMTLALDLSESQQTQIQAINLEQAKTRKAMQTERKAENPENQTSEDRYNREIARLDAKIAYKSKIKNILSETQYNKWEELQKSKNNKEKRNKSGKSDGKQSKK